MSWCIKAIQNDKSEMMGDKLKQIINEAKTYSKRMKSFIKINTFYFIL